MDKKSTYDRICAELEEMPLWKKEVCNNNMLVSVGAIKLKIAEAEKEEQDETI